MKLLLDEGLPRGAIAGLVSNGIDAVHVADTLGAGTSDEAILAAASKEGAVIVTLDGDFHALLAMAGSSSPSVIRIRIEGLKAPALTTLLMPLVRQYSGELLSGVAMTVDEQVVRFQMLPLRADR
ncbi:MAG: DUF5615 family PIN-like protein [Candidatus Sumerlaeaceae bacterium]|nr:DUF5615 family PIN-like protein [Candidatus Sumerlaeaceae bacterium]